jgi:hypothetical protein
VSGTRRLASERAKLHTPDGRRCVCAVATESQRPRCLRTTWVADLQTVSMHGPPSDPITLTLHAVRLLGFAETHRVASRFSLDRREVEENLSRL